MALRVDIEKNLSEYPLKMQFEAGNETLALLGASGSGKSMTLKMIAGIIRPDRGHIELDGVTLFDSERGINLPPQKRRVGMMFQNYALFENMTVRRNILMGVRQNRRSAAAEEEVEAILDCLHLTDLADKHPSKISGGEQQRVALGRIMVSHPNILMLDEPFSALDSHLRFQMEKVVQDAIDDFGKTVLWVSHNRDEVFRRADRVAVLNRGQIDVIGTRQEVFDHPQTVGGAVLTGCKNIFPASKAGDHRIRLNGCGIVLNAEQVPDDITHAGIRMNHVRPAGVRDDASRANTLNCKCIGETKNPFSYVVELAPAGQDTEFSLLMEIDDSLWESIRSPQITVTIDPAEVLPLRTT